MSLDDFPFNWSLPGLAKFGKKPAPQQGQAQFVATHNYYDIKEAAIQTTLLDLQTNGSAGWNNQMPVVHPATGNRTVERYVDFLLVVKTLRRLQYK